jgi:hypothetical protein
MALLVLTLITMSILLCLWLVGVLEDFMPMPESREVARIEADAETAKQAVEEITKLAQAEILSLLAQARERNRGAW